MAYRLTKLQKIILVNKDNLLKACEEENISDLVTKRMIKYYIQKKSIEEIAKEECVETYSIKQCIRRAKRKLKL